MKNTAIARLLLKTKGFDISKYDRAFLKKSIQRRMTVMHCASEELYCTLMEQNEEESIVFLDSLLIGYSEFFRNSLSFAVLEKIIFTSILVKKTNSVRKEIRIWSAACSSGQETYSLAMLLKEFKNGEGEEINFRIFATDCSEAMVNNARKGEYTIDNLSNLSFKQINNWFSKQDDVYTVKPELKENIDFSVFDLLSDEFSSPPSSIFGNFDLVVCANLLFYYKPDSQKKIIGKVTQCLTKGGFLMTGETERSILMQHQLMEVYPQSAIFKIAQ